MKEQNKEIKRNKKLLEKVEEKYIKVNTDFKNVLNDKTNIETFLKNVFPKDMHDKVIKEDYGTYEAAELSKLWLILENKNQSEFQNILSKLKAENTELVENNKKLTQQLEEIQNEFEKYKNEQKENSDNLNHYMTGFEEYKSKAEKLENEKSYLMKVLDEKNAEIEVLNSLELENAELKAKSLLNNFDLSNPIKEQDEFSKFNLSLDTPSTVQETQPSSQLKITSLNAGAQTDSKIYSQEEYEQLSTELESYKQKYDKLKKDFSDYKEKSHKILLSNEANYNKILKEHEQLKKELSQLLSKHNEQNNKSPVVKKQINTAIPPRPNLEIPSVEIDSSIQKFDINLKINNEYLKNVLLKYLEAIAIGNEFQTKILENVLFTILKVSNNDKKKLEEKRATSSFYYNLWFNAKAFLSSTIYGNAEGEESKEEVVVEEKKKEEDNVSS